MMRTATIAAVILLAAGALIMLGHDLRGWSPGVDPARDTVIAPTRAGMPAFTPADCLPGTIAFDLPRAGERQGTATLQVFACRSRSSAVRLVLGATVAVAALFAATLLIRRPHFAN